MEEVLKVPKVLITAIGSFSADVAIKTVKQLGWRVIGCDIYPQEWVADALNVHSFYQAPLASDEKAYIDFILSVISKESVDYLLPSTDYEIDVLNKYRKEIIELGTVLCLSDFDTIELCRDKWKLYNYLKNVGFDNLIPTHLVNDKADNLNFDCPLVCKPSDGRSSQGLKYFYKANDYQQFLMTSPKNYLVQPKINGSIITVDVVRQPDGKKVVAIPRKELLRTSNGAGTTVFVYNDQKLCQICYDLANLLNIKGCVNFEFIQNEDGDYFFLECNPRFSGGIEFSCMVAYQCVRNHFNCFTGKEIEELNSYKNTYIARKYEEYITKQE